MASNGSRTGRRETGTGEGRYVQDRIFNEKVKDDVQLPWEGTHEPPLGEEEIEVPYIGWTGTFSEAQNDSAIPLDKRRCGFLKHHVPLERRGNYKLSHFPGEYGEREGAGGYALCTAMTKTHDTNGDRRRSQPTPCRAKAQNLSGLCASHGGALHPLDRKRIDWEKAPRHIRFKYGRLPVSELDDEELSRGQIRKEDGTFTANPSVSTEIHDAMVKKLFERSDEKMRENLLDMVDTMTEIAKGTAYEPADRLRAAEFVFKWLRGSTPVKVEIDVAKPFEQILGAVIQGGSRAESRARRGLDEDGILDAEVVEDDELDLPEIPGLGNSEDSEGSEEPRDREDYDYRDPRDRSILRDLEPEPVIHIGPAGKPTKWVPPNNAMSETEAEHWKRVSRNEKAAEEKRAQFAKKRKAPEEIAAERKAHKEELRKGIAKRKAFQSMGQSNLPVNLDGTVEDNEDGSIQVRFDKPEEN